MPSTRSSTRRAAAASSSPTSSQDASTANTSAPASKRKADSIAGPKSKREKKGDGKTQTTIEDVMPTLDGNDPEPNSGHGDEEQKHETKAPDAPNEQIAVENQSKLEETAPKVDDKGPAAQINREEHEQRDGELKSMEIDKPDDGENDHVRDEPKVEENGNNEAAESADTATKEEPSSTDSAVEKSSQREESTPSSVLEKGLIYFFFRGRVGIDEPSAVEEIARSYIVLHPIPHGAKLGEGSIGDQETNRLLALPKKVLPASPKDRFMVFVEKANVAMEEIKSTLGSSDYATKTVGTRHSPSATPIGEGVYAITSTGRESHLAYILTVPSPVSDVQEDVGLRERGSFVTSVKNPKYPSPANASLPQAPEFPQKILDEFQGRRWMPLIPEMLDYVNAQFLLIGHAGDGLEKATAEQAEDAKQNKDTPMEELEKLEHEDEIRVEHLKGDDPIFEDLGLSAKEYSKVQVKW